MIIPFKVLCGAMSICLMLGYLIAYFVGKKHYKEEESVQDLLVKANKNPIVKRMIKKSLEDNC